MLFKLLRMMGQHYFTWAQYNYGHACIHTIGSLKRGTEQGPFQLDTLTSDLNFTLQTFLRRQLYTTTTTYSKQSLNVRSIVNKESLLNPLPQTLSGYSNAPYHIYVIPHNFLTDKSTKASKNPYDKLVDNAINSQGAVHQLDESVHHSSADSSSVVTDSFPPSTADVPDDTGEGQQRQWQWAVAEEMMTDSKEERTSQILDEVGRMEVWMDSVGDRVRNVKTKLDDMEEEGGVVLNLKDAHTSK